MSTSEQPSSAQVWKSHNFSVSAVEPTGQGAIVFALHGPFTARDSFSSLSPDAFRKTFDPPPAGAQHTAQIIDLSGVPYMDSMGLGLLVGMYVTAKKKGIPWSVRGCSARVLELFTLTKVDSFLPIED